MFLSPRGPPLHRSSRLLGEWVFRCRGVAQWWRRGVAFRTWPAVSEEVADLRSPPVHPGEPGGHGRRPFRPATRLYRERSATAHIGPGRESRGGTVTIRHSPGRYRGGRAAGRSPSKPRRLRLRLKGSARRDIRRTGLARSAWPERSMFPSRGVDEELSNRERQIRGVSTVLKNHIAESL